MPAKWYAIDGAVMTKELKQRRDGLQAFARRFYLHLADRVEVRGTDRDDLATIQHLADGSLDVTLAPLSADGSAGASYYHRRFSPKETKEVRVYLYAGNDHLVTSGPKKGDITLRVLGGRGNDALDDSKSGGADIRDSEGNNTFGRGPGTSVDTDDVEEPRAGRRKALARAARLRPLDDADARDLLGAEPGLHRGRRLLAHELGLPRLPVEELAGRQPRLFDRLQELPGHLLWRVPAERVRLDGADRPQGVGDRRPELLRDGQRDAATGQEPVPHPGGHALGFPLVAFHAERQVPAPHRRRGQVPQPPGRRHDARRGGSTLRLRGLRRAEAAHRVSSSTHAAVPRACWPNRR